MRADFSIRSLTYFLVFKLFRQIMSIKDKRFVCASEDV